MVAAKHRFHQLLRQTRENARQTTEVMAILLNLEEGDYEAIERGRKYPDNETLKRLCMMLEWNYYDTQRMIINEMSAPQAPAQSGAAASADGETALRALQSAPWDPERDVRAGPPDTLGNRLKEVRLRTGQSVDIIAMLLSIDAETYRRLENGTFPPGDDLLRRISIVYDWNYYDLITLLRAEQAKDLQPRRVGNPFPATSARHTRFKELLAELEGLFTHLPEKDQAFVIAQLELVRDTMQRLQHAS
jgi:transcriptional regulator with XRE-family HTH domain